MSHDIWAFLNFILWATVKVLYLVFALRGSERTDYVLIVILPAGSMFPSSPERNFILFEYHFGRIRLQRGDNYKN